MTSLTVSAAAPLPIRAPAVTASRSARYGIAALGAAVVIGASYSRALDLIGQRVGGPSLLLPASVAMIGALWWTSARRLRPRSRAVVPVMVLAIVHVGLALTTVLWAENRSVALEVTRYAIYDVALMAMVALLVVNADTLRLALYGVVGGGAAMASVSVFQYLTGSFDQTWFGFATAPLANVAGDVDSPRIAGPIGDPNFFAQLLAVSAVMAAHLARNVRSRAARTLLGCASIVCAAGVLFSFSRGGALALGVGFAMMILLEPIPIQRLVVAAIAVSLIIVLFIPPAVASRFGELKQLVPGLSSSQETVDDPALRGRQSEALVAVQMFTDHPLLGVGAGNYKVSYLDYASQIGIDQRGEDRSAHSLYLETAAEHGVIGIVALVAIVGWALGSIRSARRRLSLLGDRDGASVLRTIYLGLATYLIGGLFLHSAFPVMLWMLLAIAVAAGRIEATPPMRRFGVPRSAPRSAMSSPPPDIVRSGG